MARRSRSTSADTSASAVRSGCAGRTAGAEEMTMCRYINTIPVADSTSDTPQQLEELNQVMDYQNKILAQLLEAVRELSGVLKAGR